MKFVKVTISILMVFSLFICVGCSNNGTGPETQDIPLDGRGGGVIIYCYQGDGLHKIYGINADGTGNTRLINASIGLNHHDISPNGQRIACVGYMDAGFNTWSIHVFNMDGTGLTRLTTVNNVWDNEPRWSPDGSRIAFTRIYPNENDREEIRVMNSDGTNQHSIGVDGTLGGWSPDGTRFIYTSNSGGNYEIFSCNVDGTDMQQISSTPEHENFASYSPDGSQIAGSTFEGPLYNSNNAHTFEIFVMNSNGTNRQQLSNNNNFDGSPRWSPDGTQIAFGSDRHQTAKWEVYIMNADGSNIRRITNFPSGVTGINPVWRP
ncbi:MAG: hypothetical protein PVF17_06600 [Ignavibacteria bacterium]|jgi:TolB protein